MLLESVEMHREERAKRLVEAGRKSNTCDLLNVYAFFPFIVRCQVALQYIVLMPGTEQVNMN